MEEQLILFETAILAKEKGFEEIVYNMYPTTGQLEPWNRTRYELYGDYCFAPTQSLLQKWLREIHNIDIIFSPNYTMSKIKYYSFILFKDGEDDILNLNNQYDELLNKCYQDIKGNYINNELHDILIFEDSFGFKTYEEALEKGLQEALKLI